MSTKPGNLLYKCSLCGQIEENPHVPEGQLALMVAMGIVPAPSGVKEWIGMPIPGLITMHYCGDGRRGIATLIGFEEDNELADEISQHINQLDKPEKIIPDKKENVVKAAVAFMDQLNSFNDFRRPEVHKCALELQKAVGELYT